MTNGSNRKLLQTIDWHIVVCWLILVVFGAVCIYSSARNGNTDLAFMSTKCGKQVMWIGISSIVAIMILFFIKPQHWEVLALPGYLGVLLLLVGVLVFGSEVNGSKSWFHFGPLAFQPSELSKITTSLVLAHFIRVRSPKFTKFRDFLMVFSVLAPPVAAILAQGETGTLLVYISYAFVIYMEGMSGWIIGLLFLVVVLFIASMKWAFWVPLIILVLVIAAYILYYLRNGANTKNKRRELWITSTIGLVLGVALIFSTSFMFNNVLRPHQRQRIEVLLGIKEDPMGAGYNVNQSLIAIGSGGFSGKGYLQGTQTSYGFVPEQSTDFIFCTVGEEFGFIGCFLLIGLFTYLICRIVKSANDCRDAFTRVYGNCLAGCIFMHMMINVGMTIGIMPVIGIPLPFISYGGSSMLSFTTMLFIFLALLRNEKRFF